MSNLKVGVIGCGYWGPNLIRNFNENRHTSVAAICDLNASRLNMMQVKYPQARTSTDYRSVLRDDNINAVAVSTPVFSHYKIAKEALEAGKHILVEKPLTAKVRDAEKLVELAYKKGLVLLVDHTFIYTGAVRYIKKIVDDGDLGDICYFDSVRINLGLFQHDVNVIWDLAPHDLSIMDFLLSEQPVSVIATGASHTPGGLADVAYVTLELRSNLIAHFHVNWMSPVKIRKIIIGGTKKMAVFDDLDPSEKVKIYNKGISMSNASEKKMHQTLIEYRMGDMLAPAVDTREALAVEVEHFADCIINKAAPLSGGDSGLRIVRILEAAEKSLKKGGVKIYL